MKKALLLSSVLTLGLLGANIASANAQTYTVQDDDTFWTISQKLNVDINQLMTANPSVDPNFLHGGMVINLPATTASSTTTSDASAASTPITNNSSSTTYTVKAGDNFWSISQKLNVSWNNLIAANSNVNPNNLSIGMTLNVPSSNASAPAASSLTPSNATPTATPVSSSTTTGSNPSNTTTVGTPTGSTSTGSNTYKVQQGDNFWSISQKLNISWNSLIAANPSVEPNNLLVGMTLNVPSSNVTSVANQIPTSNTTNTGLTNNNTTSDTSAVQSTSSTTGTVSNGISTSSTTSDTASKPDWEVKADAIIATGMKYLGTPYVFGGSDPSTGFDCSGFTQYVFGLNGISLPHSSAMQSQMGTPVSKDQLRKGDLVFLQGTYTTGVSHVGIYMGNNQVLQAGTLNNVRAVKISTFFGTPYYDTHYWGAQRIIE